MKSGVWLEENNDLQTRRGVRFRLGPSRILVLGFSGLILVGTGLLLLPMATVPGQRTNFLTALFTATSAVCVTGLNVVDAGTHWTPFGQGVLALLMQMGGLGIMTLSTVLAMLLGKRITLKERLVIQEALGEFSLSGVVRLTRAVLLLSLSIEAIGATILTLAWWPRYSLGRALWYGVFHAVSAFNNAGFDLFGNSLIRFQTSTVIVLTVAALFMVGGLGFSVMLDIAGALRGQRRLGLHSRLVLSITGLLIGAGTVLILLLEWNNAKTLGPLSLWYKLINAFFTAVTPRTAGFNSVDIGLLHPVSLFIIIMLMFVGASPGSTGGGIKTTTFGLILAALRATIAGREEVNLYERRVPWPLVNRAWAIAVIGMLWVTLVTLLLLLTEGPQAEFLKVLFEVTSAFGTVGLSTGITPDLSTLGRVLIILTMFIGRVGPLTAAVAIAQRQRRPGTTVRFPEERVMVG